MIKFANSKTSVDEFKYKPKKIITSYYQICQFPDPTTKQYSVRKLFFDEHWAVLKTYEKSYKLDKLKKFIANTKDNKYHIYSTYDLELIDLPNQTSIMQANSPLINNYNEDYGYAPVD